MENQKHKKGKKITSLQAFEKSDCVWFQVKYGGDDFKLFHRGALENLTVKTLQNWIYSGRLFETIKAIPLDKLKKAREEIDDLDRHFDNDYFSSNNDAMFKCDEVLETLDKLIAESEE